MLTVDLDEYADYLVRKYGLSEIEPDSNRQITSEKIRSTVERNRFGDRCEMEDLRINELRVTKPDGDRGKGDRNY